jgi:hypothetical protein
MTAKALPPFCCACVGRGTCRRPDRGLRGDAAARFPGRPVPFYRLVGPHAADRMRRGDRRGRHAGGGDRGARHRAGNRVLEIGTGSGYTAAVMSRLAGRVVTSRSLQDARPSRRGSASRRSASAMRIVRQADGSGGLPGEGPFDRIVAWAAFDSLPRFLLDQLSSGGIDDRADRPGRGRAGAVPS